MTTWVPTTMMRSFLCQELTSTSLALVRWPTGTRWTSSSNSGGKSTIKKVRITKQRSSMLIKTLRSIGSPLISETMIWALSLLGKVKRSTFVQWSNPTTIWDTCISVLMEIATKTPREKAKTTISTPRLQDLTRRIRAQIEGSFHLFYIINEIWKFIII